MPNNTMLPTQHANTYSYVPWANMAPERAAQLKRRISRNVAAAIRANSGFAQSRVDTLDRNQGLQVITTTGDKGKAPLPVEQDRQAVDVVLDCDQDFHTAVEKVETVPVEQDQQAVYSAVNRDQDAQETTTTENKGKGKAPVPVVQDQQAVDSAVHREQGFQSSTEFETTGPIPVVMF
jgi:hypothetical protein